MTQTRIVIAGAGFGGLSVARELEKLGRGGGVTVVSVQNAITFNPLLPEIVGGSMLPGQVVAPIRHLLRRASFVMGEITNVDLDRGTLRVRGHGDATRTYSYDHLVFACGSTANLGLIPGMAENAMPLKTVGDALALRNRILRCLEEADVESDTARKRQLTRFVVIGGGFSGVEAAGQINDLLRAAVRHYPTVRPDDCKVVVIHRGDRILPEVSADLSAVALRKMQRRGITFILESQVSKVTPSGVELACGEAVDGENVVATIGTAPAPLVESLPLPKQRGRIETAADMSVPGFAGVWALGDCAAIPDAGSGGMVPPTAQAATHAGAHLARNLIRAGGTGSGARYRFESRGELATIGDQKAVAQIYGLHIAGFPAWLLWRAVYLIKFPTWWRKIRIWLEWTWSCVFPADIAVLGFHRSSEPEAAQAPERERPAGEQRTYARTG